MSLHALFKETDAGSIVGLLLELERAAILHKLPKLGWMTPAKLLKRSLDLLLFDRIVLFVFAATRETLPRERTLDQIEQDVTNCFQIVASALFDSLMGCDGCISGSTGEILSILVRDMLALTVLVALGQTEVNNVNIVASGLGPANQEVVRFDVTMDDSLLVHLLDSLDHLRTDQ